MAYFEHFSRRHLILKESTEKDFEELGVTEAKLDPESLLIPLPQSFSIRNEMTAVEDQGGQGSCTAFCVVACLEHVHRRDLSEGQVNHEAETTHGDCTEGLAAVHAFQICKSPGAVDENLWAYDDTQTCWANPPNTGGAQRYRFTDFGYIYRRNRPLVLQIMGGDLSALTTPGLPLSASIQRQLMGRRRPIAVSVPVVWSSWGWDGVVTMPPPSALEEFLSTMTPPNVAGWHCIAICGWDNTTGRFIFKNSWGSFWGDGGYGTIPYQYIDMYSDVGLVGW